jgi:type I restriction enzyme S subunit
VTLPSAPATGDRDGAWSVRRVGDLARLTNGYPFDSSTFGPDGDLPLVRIRDLSADEYGTYVSGPIPPSVVLRDGDIVIGMDGDFDTVLWRRGPAALNQRLCLLRPLDGVDARFVAYALPARLKVINDLTYATTVKHLSSFDVLAIRLPVPGHMQQRAIADYLDKETTMIDGIIQARHKLTALLRERRSVMITTLTTQGLHALAAPRPLQPWPPADLPSGWSLVRLRHLAHVGRGASPRPIEDPAWFDAEGRFGWVRISDVTASGRYLVSTEQRLSEAGAARSVKLEPGALILSIAASVGNPIITRTPVCIHDGFVYFSGLASLEPEYLYYLLLGGAMFGGLGKLGTQLNLNTDTVGDIRVPLPTREVQRAIVGALDERLSDIDAAISLANRQIVLLMERRRSLITAAVSGQLEIAGVAA